MPMKSGVCARPWLQRVWSRPHLAVPSRGRRQAAAAQPLRFRTAQGYEIVVGRNAGQNEQITFKLAQAEDSGSTPAVCRAPM